MKLAPSFYKIKSVALRGCFVLLAALFTCTLMGCLEVLQQSQPYPLMVLSDLSKQAPQCSSHNQLQLAVSRTESLAPLNTDRIAMLFNGRELKYMANAKFESTAPLLIQRKLIAYLSKTGCFAAVAPENTGMSSPYRLRSFLSRMYINYPETGGTPTAEIALTMYIINSDTGKMLATTELSQSVKAKEDNLNALIDAIDEVTHKTMLSACLWVNTQMSGANY